MGTGGISADAGYRQCKGNLPLLSQANASAVSAVCFAHQYRSGRPRLPISTPSSYSRDLAKQIGEFHTQGIAEDTKALTAGVSTTRSIWNRRGRCCRASAGVRCGVPEVSGGVVLFFTFRARSECARDVAADRSQSPAYDAALAPQYGSSIEEFYEQIDQVLGEVLPKVDENTTLLVLSDHGFAPYRHSFNLNTWLLNNGYIARKEVQWRVASRFPTWIGTHAAYGWG